MFFFQCQYFFLSCPGLAALRRTEIKEFDIFRFVNKTSPSIVTPVDPASLYAMEMSLCELIMLSIKGQTFFVDEISSRFLRYITWPLFIIMWSLLLQDYHSLFLLLEVIKILRFLIRIKLPKQGIRAKYNFNKIN